MHLPVSAVHPVSSIIVESTVKKHKHLTLFRYVGGSRGAQSMGLRSCVVGLSTGLLPAAVVALSPSIPALMPLAVEAVLVAFRLGLYVKTTANNIEPSPAHDDDSSWSYVIPGKTKSEVQSALDDFHLNEVIEESTTAQFGQTDSFSR